MTEHWLNALGRWEAERAEGQRLAELVRAEPRRLRGRWEAAVVGVGINPRWRVSVRVRRRPGPPDGGGEAYVSSDPTGQNIRLVA